MSDHNQNESPKNTQEYEAWQNMVECLRKFISASKDVVKILSKKCLHAHILKSEQNFKCLDESKEENRKKSDDIEEIHLNPYFSVESLCTTNCNDHSYQLGLEYCNKTEDDENFLGEQYNLMKQAITRRYKPQTKLAILRRNAMAGCIQNRMYDGNAYRMTTMASNNGPDYETKYSLPKNSITPCQDVYIMFNKKKL